MLEEVMANTSTSSSSFPVKRKRTNTKNKQQQKKKTFKRSKRNAKDTYDTYDGDTNKAPRDEVVEWMKRTFHLDPFQCLPKQLVFTEYVKFCEEAGWSAASPASCGRLVHQAFPDVTCTRKGGRGVSAYHYGNLAFRDDAKQPTTKRKGRHVVRSWPSASMAIKRRKNKSTTSEEEEAEEEEQQEKEEEEEEEEEEVKKGGRSPNSNFRLCTASSRSSLASPPSSPSCSSSDNEDSYNNHYNTHNTHNTHNDHNTHNNHNNYNNKKFDGPLLTIINSCDQTLSNVLLIEMFDSYYQDLLFFLLLGSDTQTQEVIQRFWQEELYHELKRREVSELLKYEQRGVSRLVEKLIANPTNLPIEVLADYLQTISMHLPVWIQTQAMDLLPNAATTVYSLFWSHVAQDIERIADYIRVASY